MQLEDLLENVFNVKIKPESTKGNRTDAIFKMHKPQSDTDADTEVDDEVEQEFPNTISTLIDQPSKQSATFKRNV